MLCLLEQAVSAADDQKAYEVRPQRRLQITLKQFEAGKIRIAEGLGGKT
jgi:hypothetical protein